MDNKNEKIDFMCIGGNKYATTWLSEMLRQHPQLNVSLKKEPNFHTRNYNLGYEWYFNNWEQRDSLKGEFSATYLYDADALEKIAQDFKDIKIIIVLRNPYYRALSHLRHLYRYATAKTGKDITDIGSFVDQNKEIIENSLYYKYIGKVSSLFDKNNVHIIYFDEIENNTLPCD